MKRTWQIDDVTEAARARIATARLAAAYGVPALDRTRLTTALSAQLRQCLTKGGAWLLTLDVTAGGAEPGALHVSLVPCDPAQSAAQPPWRATVDCPGAAAPVDGCEPPDEAPEPAESLLWADEDTAVVLEKLADQEELVAFHREELHQTNQGVVALHAELDAAGRAQREAFAAERKARREAEKASRRLTFLANTSAVLTSSLNHEEIVRRLPELLVPEYARSVDVWLFDGDGDRQLPTPHPAAAVVAARTGRPNCPCCASRCRRAGHRSGC
jgi:hypothetical protein